MSGTTRAADDEDLRALLLAELDTYRGVDDGEERHRAHIRSHVASTSGWWHRDTLPGHVTASVFVVSPEVDQMLLHHHRRLDRWLQFGGHDDGEQCPARAAVRELAEESGLQDFAFLPGPAIFDVDVHPIPAAGGMPAHDHLDVRFLVTAEPDAVLAPQQGESRVLRWFPLETLPGVREETGLARVQAKLRALSSALAGG